MKSLLNYCLLLFLATSTFGQVLQWDNNTETNLAGYKVYIQPTNSATIQVVTKTNTHNLTNLVLGQRYQFYVTAFNTEGVESVPSESLNYQYILRPSQPTVEAHVLRRISTNQWQLAMSWDASPTNELVIDYKVVIVQGNVTVTNLVTTGTSAVMTIPIVNPTYVFLIARNQIGSSDGGAVLTFAPPVAPNRVRIVTPYQPSSSSTPQ